MTLLKIMWIEDKIKHFTISEVTMGRDIPAILHPNIRPTIVFVDQMRDHLGFPIAITSSYRSEAYNRLVGGVKNSLHLKFNALDVVPVSGRKSDLEKMHEYAESFSTNKMGVGYYNSFLHLDTRGCLGRKSPVTWGKRIYI